MLPYWVAAGWVLLCCVIDMPAGRCVSAPRSGYPGFVLILFPLRRLSLFFAVLARVWGSLGCLFRAACLATFCRASRSRPPPPADPACLAGVAFLLPRGAAGAIGCQDGWSGCAARGALHAGPPRRDCRCLGELGPWGSATFLHCCWWARSTCCHVLAAVEPKLSWRLCRTSPVL